MDVVGSAGANSYSYQIYHIIEHEVSVVIDINLSKVIAPLSTV